ncbi:MAG: dUTP diphosphatase [Proteobacteria bacterium]|nr:MAG: dUTP diphosphatase [Pseudomonadota bacterium]PIE64963.1 MAG: dUTP diphosphatase [Desulfobacterales bacterium]
MGGDKEVVVAVSWLDPEKTADLALPDYETSGSAGMDVCAAVGEAVILRPGERVLVPTGFGVAIPEGYEIQIRPRSGLAIKHGITLINAPGTIDSDYRGEVKLALINLGDEEYRVNRGDRIAQMVVAPVIRASFRPVAELSDTERGSGGFGHTGV